MRATFKLSLVASWRATVKRSGLLLVKATARMAVSASCRGKYLALCTKIFSNGQRILNNHCTCRAVAKSSGLDLVRAILRRSGSAFMGKCLALLYTKIFNTHCTSVRAVAKVSGLAPVKAVARRLDLTPPVRAVARSRMSAS